MSFEKVTRLSKSLISYLYIIISHIKSSYREIEYSRYEIIEQFRRCSYSSLLNFAYVGVAETLDLAF